MGYSQDSRLKGRVAIVTGGSSGIGKEIAKRFTASGAKVVIADLKSSGVESELNKQHGDGTATFVECNVTDESQIEKLVAESAKWGGRVDILCAFAGVAMETPKNDPKFNAEKLKRAHEFETKLFDTTMAINVRGVWLSCKYAIAQMLKQDPLPANYRGDATRGWIVNAASVYGLVASQAIPAYATSKHAVVGMTKQLAIDYAKDRIHVNCVNPGYVVTPLIDHIVANNDMMEMVKGAHPWGELGTPEDVANATLFLCTDEAAWVTGHSMVIDGGFTAQ